MFTIFCSEELQEETLKVGTLLQILPMKRIISKGYSTFKGLMRKKCFCWNLLRSTLPNKLLSYEVYYFEFSECIRNLDQWFSTHKIE
jgi:hypothetical protein